MHRNIARAYDCLQHEHDPFPRRVHQNPGPETTKA